MRVLEADSRTSGDAATQARLMNLIGPEFKMAFGSWRRLRLRTIKQSAVAFVHSPRVICFATIRRRDPCVVLARGPGREKINGRQLGEIFKIRQAGFSVRDKIFVARHPAGITETGSHRLEARYSEGPHRRRDSRNSQTLVIYAKQTATTNRASGRLHQASCRARFWSSGRKGPSLRGVNRNYRPVAERVQTSRRRFSARNRQQTGFDDARSARWIGRRRLKEIWIDSFGMT